MSRHPPQKKREWGAGRIAFLAQIDELRALVAAGWPLKKIYRDRRMSLADISYQWFCRYVQKHIGSFDEAEREQRAGAARSAHEAQTPAADRRGVSPSARAAPHGTSSIGGPRHIDVRPGSVTKHDTSADADAERERKFYGTDGG
ncbi:MAG TPA: TraK family protein [Anaeromyxobacteraceae bacterium]|nr:TraK family protein [Anaeromyxobacteraceae bacterium]